MDWWSPESTPTTIRPRRAATFNLFVVLGEILDTYSATWEVRSVRQIVGKSADTVWQCKPQTPIQFILCTRRNIGHLFNLILLWSLSHGDKKQLRPCPSQVLLPQQTFRLLRWYHAEQGWGQEYPQAQGHTFEEIDVLEQRFCETDCRKICRHCKRVRDDNDWDLRPKSLKKKFQKKDPFPESFLAALTCWQFINQTCIEFWCQLALLCLQKKDMTKCAHFHVILHRFVCLGCTLCWKSSPPARKENLSWKGWMIRFIRKSSRGSSTLFLREKFYFCVRDTYSFYSEFIRRDMVRSFIQDTRLIFQEICAHVTCSQSKSTRFEETWSAYSRHLFSLFVVKIYSAFDLIQSILKLVHGDDDWIYTLYSRALVRGFNGRSRNKARRVNLDLEMTMTNDKDLRPKSLKKKLPKAHSSRVNDREYHRDLARWGLEFEELPCGTGYLDGPWFEVSQEEVLALLLTVICQKERSIVDQPKNLRPTTRCV